MWKVFAVALFCSAFAVQPVLSDDLPVDLELILSVDISRSMDFDEQRLQRQGYVNAITNPLVMHAISQGVHGRVAVTYIEWAGPDAQQTVVEWRMIDDESSARAFAEDLSQAPILSFRGTSIGSGLVFARPRFDSNGFDGARRVIDVSGDGPNNMGYPVTLARDQLVADGVTINGLPIMIKRASGFASINDLDIYYHDCVIGGPGAFLIAVRAPEQFAEAIRRKLILEIAGLMPDDPMAIRIANRQTDCLIGEKLRQQWMRE